VLFWSLQDSAHAPHAGAVDEPAAKDRATTSATQAAVKQAEAAREPTTAAKRALDCNQPKGDAARSTAGVISVTELCTEFQQLSGQQAKGEPKAQRTQARQTLDMLIDEQLVTAALAADHVTITDADIDEAFAQLPMVKANTDKVALQEALHRQGIDMAVLRRDLRRRVLFARLVAARGNTEPQPLEIDLEVTQHPEHYQKDSGTQIQAYIARVAPNAPPEVVEQAHKSAETFAIAVDNAAPETLPKDKQLQALPPFEVQANELEPGLVAAVAPLQPGQWTPAVRTRAGWLVGKVVARKAVKKLSEQARLIAELRKSAAIEVLVDL
jgi:hypothetical protein